MKGESLCATPLAAALDSDAAETVVLTAKPSLSIDLSRLCMYAGLNTAIIYPTLDVSPYVGITSYKVDSHEYIVGASGAHSPSPWSPYRRLLKQFPWDEPWWFDLDESNTISWGLLVEGVGVVGDVSLAAPCYVRGALGARSSCDGSDGLAMAAAFRSKSVAERGRPERLSSPVSEHAATAGGDLTLTAQESGILDLGTLRLKGMSDEAAATEGAWIDALASTTISAITDVDNQSILYGDNTPIVPAAMFSNQHGVVWVDFGIRRMAPNTTFKMTVKNNGPDTSNYSAAANFYPLSAMSRGCQEIVRAK